MNLINSLLKTYFYENREKFGQDAVFEGFKQVGSASMDEKFAFNVVFGSVIYTCQNTCYSSKLMLAKYFDSKTQSLSGGYDVLSRFTVEMSFFRNVLPAFNSLRSAKHLVPELWAAGAATTGSSDLVAIVFEHLDGFTEFGCSSFLDYPHLSLMARRIGEFHAYSMAARKANPHYLAQVNYSLTTFEQYHQVLPLLDRCLQSLHLDSKYQYPEDQHYVDGIHRLKQMVDQFPQCLHEPLTASSRHDCWVLCHQNYSQANVLYRYDETQQPVDMRICNWQWMGFASLGVDLVILLFVETNEETRMQFFDQLLIDYHEALRSTFGDILVPSMERIFDEIKISIPIALYVLASRVQAQLQIADSKLSTPLWTEDRIIDMLKNLISTSFI